MLDSAVHENCVRVTRELPKSEFPISERESIDSSGPRESEGPGGSSLLGEGQVASEWYQSWSVFAF
jgi:hypothetical protein